MFRQAYKRGADMRVLLAVAAFLAVFGLAGAMDYQDELREAEYGES